MSPKAFCKIQTGLNLPLTNVACARQRENTNFTNYLRLQSPNVTVRLILLLLVDCRETAEFRARTLANSPYGIRKSVTTKVLKTLVTSTETFRGCFGWSNTRGRPGITTVAIVSRFEFIATNGRLIGK